MNRFDFARKFLISKNQENIKAIEEYSLELDDRSYITLVCEIFNSYFKRNGESQFKDFESIPVIDMKEKVDNVDNYLSIDNIINLIKSLNLEENLSWDLYKEEHFINFIKTIHSKLPENDKIKFISFLDGYNLYIKNDIDYFDVNLLQFFNFPNFGLSESYSPNKKLFYIQLEKFILNNTVKIISSNIMDKYFSFGNYRVDEKTISNIDGYEKTFLEYAIDKIIKSSDLSDKEKQELAERLLHFYSDYNFFINKKEDDDLLNNGRDYIQNAFLNVFQNRTVSVITANNIGNYFSIRKAKESRIKKAISSN